MLILAVSTTLAACGDGDKATTAGSATPAPTSAAPSAVATSAAATPSSAAAGSATDKQLCEAVKKANDEMRAEMVKIAMTGELSAADAKKLLTGLEQKVAAVASTGDGKLADAVRTFSAEAAKAAAAPDPAVDNPALEKAGRDVSTACKAHGISMVL